MLIGLLLLCVPHQSLVSHLQKPPHRSKPSKDIKRQDQKSENKEQPEQNYPQIGSVEGIFISTINQKEKRSLTLLEPRYFNFCNMKKLFITYNFYSVSCFF